ncbi:hypothetical protein [Methylobacterium sp. WL6]|uniref:hypothetical protein n=1 Tax=Methylobacterium sp. WL6 TaxID=2603901 RepID=UPI0011CA0BE8|nr:hypothetical protein [Methylobacterium sp. WL6]TXN72397.1 hypothetical protein FV230_05060 [Methylobacterium sp. WL6]
MLGKFRSIFGAQATEPQARADHRPSMSIEELMGSFPAMKPVLPPSAGNDDLMAPVYAVVEEELLRAGLRERRQG